MSADIVLLTLIFNTGLFGVVTCLLLLHRYRTTKAQESLQLVTDNTVQA